MIEQNVTWLGGGYSEHDRSYSRVTAPPLAVLCHQASSALSTAPSLYGQSAASITVKVKGVYSSLLTAHHKARERHLPYGIAQCYLSPDTGERTTP